MDKRIAAAKCGEYNTEKIKAILSEQFTQLGIDLSRYSGRKVAIKPNLVMKASPDKAATTHPTVIEAAASLLCEAGAEVTIAESPGGIYSEKLLEGFYRTCGLTDIAERLPIKLNYDTGFTELHAEYAKTSKVFNIINPIYEADVIFNICKLKTHTFMMMSAATKNLFGTVPGIQKFEMHARFTNERTFAEYINDLTATLCREKETVHIVDAVVGMQGNGPTGGTPLDIGAILTGLDPFTLDTACSDILGLDGRVIMQTAAQSDGLCPSGAKELTVYGEPLENLRVSGYIPPDTLRGKKFTIIPDFLSPRPEVDPSVCVGCGECASNCPVKTIRMITLKNGKKRARIDRSKCIKCYCCQELCHFRAVRIKKNFIYQLVK